MQNRLKDIQTLIKLGDIKKAEVTIARLLDAEPEPSEQAELLILRARTRLLTNRITEAIEIIQSAQNIDASAMSDIAQELLANCYLARFEGAVVGFAQKSDVREAQHIYQNIIQTNPEYENMGWVYYQQGRISLIEGQSYAAESYFHKALLSPSNIGSLTAYCYERLGFIAYYESRQPKQALMYLNKAIDTYPSAEPRLRLVQIYLLQSRVLRDSNLVTAIESAQEAFHLAENINNTIAAEALFTLAELLTLHQGRNIEVVECLRQYMQITKAPVGIDVAQSRAYEMLADAYFALGQYVEAVDGYEEALTYNPDHPWEETIRYRIAKAHYQHQNYAAVLDNLKSIVEDSQDYRIFNLLGNAFYGLHDFKQAASAYQKAIRLAPQGIDIETMRMYYQLSQQMNSPL